MNSNFKRVAIRGVAGFVLAGTVAVAGCGMADAATPAGTSPALHTVIKQISPRQLSQGFNVYNDSAETFTFERVTGSLPAPDTSVFDPAQRRNFELPDNFTYKSGDVYYAIMAADGGGQMGTLDLAFNNSAAWSAKFSNMDGSSMGSMTAAQGGSDGSSAYLEDAVGSPASQQTYTAGSTDEQTALTQLCDTDASACTFTPTSEVTDFSTPKLLAEGYNGNAIGTGDSTLTANNGYTDSTTDTWGASVTATGKVLGIVDVAVQASYNHAVTASTDFSTSWSDAVAPGTTGYIWAQIPQFQDNGTFAVHLGNTHWNLPGVVFDNAQPKGVIMYSNTTAQGDAPQPLDPGSHS